jgi:hypothetical protein
MMQHANVLVDTFNNSLRGNSIPRPMLRVNKAGELSEEDVDRLKKFFKLHGEEIEDFIATNKNVPKDNSIFYFRRLKEMSDSGALSFMTEGDSNASLYLQDMNTPKRGKFANEKSLGNEGYFTEGIAFFTDPRNKNSRLNMIELLNSPVFIDPQFFSQAYAIARKKGKGKFETLAREIMPLVTGSYFKGNLPGMGGEESAMEYYYNNPFVKRMREATSSPEKFEEFLNFFNGAMEDLGTVGERKVSEKTLLNPGLDKFFDKANAPKKLDDDEVILKPTETAGDYEKLFFNSWREFDEDMKTLIAKGGTSTNDKIGSTLTTLAIPIYNNYFAPYVEARNQGKKGINVEPVYKELRANILDYLNDSIAKKVFKDNNGKPYNYFANPDKIQGDRKKNGVLTANYILENFDEKFYKKLLAAKVDENGVLNPDLQPVVEQAKPVIEQIPTVAPTPVLETPKQVIPKVEESKVIPKKGVARKKAKNLDDRTEETIPTKKKGEGLLKVPKKVEEVTPIVEAEPEKKEETTGTFGEVPIPKTINITEEPRLESKYKSADDENIPDEVRKNEFAKQLFNGNVFVKTKDGQTRTVRWKEASDDEKGYALLQAAYAATTEDDPNGMKSLTSMLGKKFMFENYHLIENDIRNANENSISDKFDLTNYGLRQESSKEELSPIKEEVPAESEFDSILNGLKAKQGLKEPVKIQENKEEVKRVPKGKVTQKKQKVVPEEVIKEPVEEPIPEEVKEKPKFASQPRIIDDFPNQVMRNKIKKYRNLDNLLNGLVSGGTGKEVKSWEPLEDLDKEDVATDEQRMETLYNALISTASDSKPWGLNPEGTSKRGGIDDLIDLDWAKNAVEELKKYMKKLKIDPDEWTPNRIKRAEKFAGTSSEEDRNKPVEEVTFNEILEHLKEEQEEGVKYKKEKEARVKGETIEVSPEDSVYTKKKTKTLALPKVKGEEHGTQRWRNMKRDYFAPTLGANKADIEHVKADSGALIEYLKSLVDTSGLKSEQRAILNNHLKDLNKKINYEDPIQYNTALELVKKDMDKIGSVLDDGNVENNPFREKAKTDKEIRNELDEISANGHVKKDNMPEFLNILFKGLENNDNEFRRNQKKYATKYLRPDENKKIALLYADNAAKEFAEALKISKLRDEIKDRDKEIFEDNFGEFINAIKDYKNNDESKKRLNSAKNRLEKIKSFDFGLGTPVSFVIGTRDSSVVTTEKKIPVTPASEEEYKAAVDKLKEIVHSPVVQEGLPTKEAKKSLDNKVENLLEYIANEANVTSEDTQMAIQELVDDIIGKPEEYDAEYKPSKEREDMDYDEGEEEQKNVREMTEEEAAEYLPGTKVKTFEDTEKIKKKRDALRLALSKIQNVMVGYKHRNEVKPKKEPKKKKGTDAQEFAEGHPVVVEEKPTEKKPTPWEQYQKKQAEIKAKSKPVEAEVAKKPTANMDEYDGKRDKLDKMLRKYIVEYGADEEASAENIDGMLKAIDDGDVDQYKYYKESLAASLKTKSFFQDSDKLFREKNKS